MKVMLTGTTGMVGGNLLELLKRDGTYEILSPQRKELNLLDKDNVFNYMKQHKPDAVVHMAAVVGGIQANINEPVRFLVENSYINLNVINAALAADVPKLIYTGSACMYPKDRDLLPESLILDGKLEPTNEPYAIAKISGAILCEAISKQYGLDYKTIIPCNLYGPYDNFHPISSHMIPGVIRKLHEANLAGQQEVGIWGDGTARREFMYIGDLVRFIQFALEQIERLPSLINVGLGYDHTVNEYYQTVAEVVGYRGSFKHELDKPVGMRSKLLESSKARALGWQPKTELKEGLKKTYDYFLSIQECITL